MNCINHCNKERNIGLDILKVWMSFEVVLCHFGHGSGAWIYSHFFAYFKRMAVPVFMIVSFYLSARFISDKEWHLEKLAKRLYRIYWPLVAWGIICWIVYNILALLCNADDFKYSFSDLVWQVLTGHCYNPPMWFNAVLGCLTILFYRSCLNFIEKSFYVKYNSL